MKKNTVRLVTVMLSLIMVFTCFVGLGTSTFAANTPMSRGSGVNISSLKVYDTDNAADWSIQAKLQEGAKAFGDRSGTIDYVIPYLVGKEWIRPANDSKTYTSDPLCTFVLNSNAIVYLPYNDGVVEKPEWLSSFTKTRDTMSVTGITYTIYKKVYAAGTTVELGQNGNVLPSTYIIVISPFSGPTPSPEPTVSPTPILTPTPTPTPIAPPSVMTSGDVVENFTSPITFTDGMAFGKDGILTMETAGSPIFDNSSLKYLYAVTPNKEDAYIIRTTNPLPKTYKVSVDIGNIYYDLTKINDMENGYYFGAIFLALPEPTTNEWFHHNRKIIFDTDNNSSGYGGVHPIFAGYYDSLGEEFYSADANGYTRSWVRAASYDPYKWYTFGVEKTLTQYILTVSDAISHKMIVTAKIPLADVINPEMPDYLLIGDPHINYYNGSVRIANIRIRDTTADKPAPTVTPKPTPTPDITAPAAPKVNAVTSKAKTVTGKTEAKALVTVKVGAKKLGTATADAQGKFKVVIKAQKAGTVLSVTATDKAKNVSKVTKVKVKK